MKLLSFRGPDGLACAPRGLLRRLQPGDRIRVEISRIGVLEHEIAA